LGQKTILIDQIQENGFETFNPILNLGGIFVIVALYVAKVIFVLSLQVLAWAFRFANRISRSNFEGGEKKSS